MWRWVMTESRVLYLMKSKDNVHEKHERHESKTTKLSLGFFVLFVYFVDQDFDFEPEELR